MLLYRVEDEIAIEMSPAAWRFVEAAIEEHRARYSLGHDLHLKTEVDNFANAIEAHLQHLVPVKVPGPNDDLL